MVVAAMVAVAAVSAIAQYYQAEKARGANQSRLDELEAAFDSLTPPNFDYTIMDPPELLAQAEIPEMDFSEMTPELYKIVGKYVPEVAPYIAEKRPELLKMTGDAKKGKQAQLDALKHMMDVAKSGRDPMLDDAMDKASKSAQIAAQSRTESTLQDEQRRGTMGSGRGFAAKMIGNQDAMQSAASSSRDSALASYQAKLNAMRQSADIGNQVYGNEMAFQGRNTDIINSFNERTSKGYQDYQKYKTDILNKAQFENLNTEQSISNANTDMTNTYAVDERDRRDDLTKWKYGAESDKVNQTNNDTKWTYGQEKDERDNQNDLAASTSDWEMNKMKGKHGIAGDQIDNTNQSASDTNNSIQTVSDATIAGIEYKDKADRDEERRRKK